MNDLEKEAYECGRLRRILVTIDKNFPLQAHDYMIMEDPDFKGKIIDIGCGTGEFAIVAKLKNPKLNIGLYDGSLLNLNIAHTLAMKAGAVLNYKQGLIETIEFPDKFFDTLVLNHIVEHIEDLDTLFAQLKRILKDDGTIFIAVPYKNCHYSPNHVNFFSEKKNDTCFCGSNLCNSNKCIRIKDLFKKYGFEGEYEVFDEEKKDKRHPYKSRGQLDIVIKMKKGDENRPISKTD